MALHECSHRPVDRCHHLLRHLHHRHFRAGVSEALGHLQSDETASHHHRLLHFVMREIVLYPVRVVNVAQGEDAFSVDAGQWRAHGRCSGRKQELVVVQQIGLAVGLSHSDLLPFGQNLSRLVLCPDVDVEASPEGFGCLHKQPVALGDDAADIIWQSAVGVRDISASLQEHNLCIFCQSSDACRSRCAARHATYDDIPCLLSSVFHSVSVFCLQRYVFFPHSVRYARKDMIY